MAEKVCLDTDICIAVLNGEKRVEDFRKVLTDSELFTTSITVFELYLRDYNLDKIIGLLNNVYVLNFDEICAIKASNIQKQLKSKGVMLEFRDVFIASIAIINNCSLATFNKKHFSRIKNLELLKF